MHIRIFLDPFSPITVGFVPYDARVLAGLPDSILDLFKRSLFTITKDNNISEKSRVTRKKRPLFSAQCSGEIRHYGYFEIALTPGRYIYTFFTEMIEQNYVFSGKTF